MALCGLHGITRPQQLPVQLEKSGPSGRYLIMNLCHACAFVSGAIIAMR
jgi:hypothetical protein